MPGLSVLICGSGIAGPTLAYFLTQANVRVKIIERSASPRHSGLGVDIRGPALDVIRRMGLEERIRGKTTGEEGLVCVDSDGKVLSRFLIDGDDLENSPTSDCEIMRSELAELLCDAALGMKGVEVEYGIWAEGIAQDELGVQVEFSSGRSERFDLVVAADGLGSATRKLVLHMENMEVIHSLGQYTAYFSIPREESDGKFWQWHAAPNSLQLFIRPKNEEECCAYLSIMPHEHSEPFRTLIKASTSEQKVVLASFFEGGGWQTERLLSGMCKAEDFYLQHIAQVKLSSWSEGRCVVVGDAAYCPSPLSGLGTSLAILGAYVLAGEIAKESNGEGDGVKEALARYERKMRPYVEEKQKLLPGMPWLVCPRSKWGVGVLNWIVWLVPWSRAIKLLRLLRGKGEGEKFELDNYQF
ncbi:hypothetical protein BJ875DRAFT_38147 [Amylocarpus encephaloides]|uniref:FAD-binding domain-containing protein n=1 Tax=Amylocarpus encephaloides TaxID=45428 RepID=A0A9P7YHL6_9HELO|nr:hypothetical protein BJ875DRAFT_38147 [Amylocarpus encephaloides]